MSPFDDDVAARARVARQVAGGEVDAPLGARTTYRVGGPAALLLELDDPARLPVVREAMAASALPLLVVGNGSNLLVGDEGFPGIALVLGGHFADIEVDGTEVTAGAAVGLPVLARRTVAAGLTGLEWAVGVPGTVGGAVRMNAGGHGSDVAATLRRVRLFDTATGHDGTVESSALDLAYRHSNVAAHQVVVSATFALASGDPATGDAELKEIVRWRRENQPGGQNAGSVFTNPQGDSAGRLIDAAGLKGHRVGTARVSEKHANFFIADDGGSADDVHRLMLDVRRRVHESSGVVLREETRLVGLPALADADPLAAGGER